MFQLKWLVLDIFLPIFRKEITNFLQAPQEDNKKSCKNIDPCQNEGRNDIHHISAFWQECKNVWKEGRDPNLVL